MGGVGLGEGEGLGRVVGVKGEVEGEVGGGYGNGVLNGVNIVSPPVFFFFAVGVQMAESFEGVGGWVGRVG